VNTAPDKPPAKGEKLEGLSRIREFKQRLVGMKYLTQFKKKVRISKSVPSFILYILCMKCMG
jgi:hypothetical protein